MKELMMIFLAYLAFMSLVSFILYGSDKRKAKRQKWRVPEKVLLGFGFLGGAFGGLIGMRTFRHKTKHWYFWVINILGVIWQTATCIYIAMHI